MRSECAADQACIACSNDRNPFRLQCVMLLVDDEAFRPGVQDEEPGQRIYCRFYHDQLAEECEGDVDGVNIGGSLGKCDVYRVGCLYPLACCRSIWI